MVDLAIFRSDLLPVADNKSTLPDLQSKEAFEYIGLEPDAAADCWANFLKVGAFTTGHHRFAEFGFKYLWEHGLVHFDQPYFQQNCCDKWIDDLRKCGLGNRAISQLRRAILMQTLQGKPRDSAHDLIAAWLRFAYKDLLQAYRATRMSSLAAPK